MHTRVPITMTYLLLYGFFLLTPNTPVVGSEAPREANTAPMKVQGVVVDLGADLIVVKTSAAKFTLDKKMAPLNARIGDKVTLWVDTGHAVIDHHRQETGRRHRFHTGTLLDPASMQQLKLWTPEGTLVYSLVAHEAKTAGLAEGTMVTVEIDEGGIVVDVYPVETRIAACDKRHSCKVLLHGTVSKIEDRMIFIHTPVIEYEIPTTIAPRDAAVGDEMTLWVYEDNVVLNYYKEGGAETRRFVTGPLKYADGTKSHVQLWTPEGEKTFAMPPSDKANTLQEGRLITLEVSETGTALDLWESS
jgi:hypothetical protein